MQAVTQNVGAHLKPLTRFLRKKPDSYHTDWNPPALLCQHPWTSSSILHFPLDTESHSALAARHTSIMYSQWETQTSSTGQGLSPWNTSKVSSHETSYEICGQLTQRIRANMMFSGCFCLSYTIVLCGFIFRLKQIFLFFFLNAVCTIWSSLQFSFKEKITLNFGLNFPANFKFVCFIHFEATFLQFKQSNMVRIKCKISH